MEMQHTMNDLVQRLSQPQRVLIKTRLDDSVEDLRGQLERGYVFLQFTETRGGTELGVRLDREQSDLDASLTGEGSITLVGTLVLNYVRVRAHAKVGLPGLEGEGHLEVIEEVSPAQLAKERGAVG